MDDVYRQRATEQYSQDPGLDQLMQQELWERQMRYFQNHQQASGPSEGIGGLRGVAEVAVLFLLLVIIGNVLRFVFHVG